MQGHADALMGNTDAQAIFEIGDVIKLHTKAGEVFCLHGFKALNFGFGTEEIAHFRETKQKVIKPLQDIQALGLDRQLLNLQKDRHIRVAQTQQVQAILPRLDIKAQLLAQLWRGVEGVRLIHIYSEYFVCGKSKLTGKRGDAQTSQTG